MGRQWDDVDFDEATLTITSTLHRGVHGRWLGPTKPLEVDPALAGLVPEAVLQRGTEGLWRLVGH